MASSERSLIPIDLIEETFCRIPIEYLTKFKLACKQWYALLKDKRFIYKYLDLVQERFIRIDDGMVQIINPENGARSSSPIPDVFHNVAEISAMVHCDGLILCRCKDTRSRTYKLSVWNPFLNRIKWIEPMDFYSSNDFYGIGYNNVVSRDEYKVLRIFDGQPEDGSEIAVSYQPKIQLYDFKYNSWRLVNDTTLDWSIDPPCKGVSVKGNMYWVAHWNNRPEIFIQSFDFSTETFKLVSNLPFRCGVLDTAALSSFRGDKLSLLYQHEEATKIEVWITNKLSDEVVSWTKYLNVTSPELPTLHTDEDLAHPSYFIGKNDNIMVWCEEEIEDETNDDVCVSVYKISKDGIVKKQVDVGLCDLRNDGRAFVCGYVYLPSLVPVPE
ncbi:putative F-box protein [Cardamine amara subsp. amara]|uniref:F-box protein n=1 Tax=Cardamine amara subsp. amara TaxID=228776 RepID=A0ABD1A880_CARAN